MSVSHGGATRGHRDGARHSLKVILLTPSPGTEAAAPGDSMPTTGTIGTAHGEVFGYTAHRLGASESAHHPIAGVPSGLVVGPPIRHGAVPELCSTA